MAINQLKEGQALDTGGLKEYVEEIRNRKQELINQKGETLAERLGTKW